MIKELEKVFTNSVEAFNEDQYNDSDDDLFEELYNNEFHKKRNKSKNNNWE